MQEETQQPLLATLPPPTPPHPMPCAALPPPSWAATASKTSQRIMKWDLVGILYHGEWDTDWPPRFAGDLVQEARCLQVAKLGSGICYGCTDQCIHPSSVQLDAECPFFLQAPQCTWVGRRQALPLLPWPVGRSFWGEAPVLSQRLCYHALHPETCACINTQPSSPCPFLSLKTFSPHTRSCSRLLCTV